MKALKECCRISKELLKSVETNPKRERGLSLDKIIKKLKWIVYQRKNSYIPDLETAYNNRDVCNYLLNIRIAVYTCIFGKYDSLKEPIFVPDNCDFYVVTDQDVKKNSAWKKIDIGLFGDIRGLDNTSKNRYFKFFPDILFPEYKYSIYIDGSIVVYSDLTEHVHRLSEIGIAVFKHQKRRSAYEEIEACLAMHRGEIKKVKEYRAFLKRNGFPNDYGLAACGFIVREHNKESCKKIMRAWWREFQKSGNRDQICFPYALYNNGIEMSRVTTLGGDIHKDNSFMVTRHT